KVVRYSVLTLTLAGMALSLGRTLLFVCLAWAAVAATLTGHTKGLPIAGQVVKRVRSSSRRRRVVGAAVIGLLVFQGFALLLGKTGADDPRFVDSVHPALRGSQLTSAVIYLSGSIPAFGELVDGPGQHEVWPDAPR